MTFGIILFALMTSSSLPASPIPKRLHSLILQRDARLTVVPSISTGVKTATGVMVDAAQDHSICSSLDSTDSVSYTHLDVYKRQVKGTLIFLSS